MSKRVIVIISIVSALIFIGGIIAAGVIFVKKIGPIIEKNMENTQVKEDRTPEDVLADISAKNEAPDWSKGLKTGYSYEIKDKAGKLVGSRISFIASLYDIIKSGESYYAVMTDRNINASFSIVYRIKCSKEQLNRFIAAQEKENEDKYMVYACAAAIEKATEGQDDGDYWSPSLIFTGTLIDFEGVLQEGYDDEGY